MFKGIADRTHRSTNMEGLLGRRLNDIEEVYAPATMHYDGSMDIPIRQAMVSVIGTRNPTDEGIRLARDITEFLVKQGAAIVSGLASGIDTIAHKTAMECMGRTVAVIGTPLDRTYPMKNAALQQKLMEDHLVVSQYPTGHPTTKKDFVFRNRTMALISDASIIVEAGDGSGTLHQGREALRLGRPLFVTGLSLRNKELEWTRQMMDDGAVELVDYEQVLEFLPSYVQTRELFQ